jgi:hypothetical protein
LGFLYCLCFIHLLLDLRNERFLLLSDACLFVQLRLAKPAHQGPPTTTRTSGDPASHDEEGQ